MHLPLREYSENYWETRGEGSKVSALKEKRESLSPVFPDRKASMMLVTIEFQSGIKGFPSPISTQFLPSERRPINGIPVSMARCLYHWKLNIERWLTLRDRLSEIVSSDRTSIPLIWTHFIVLLFSEFCLRAREHRILFPEKFHFVLILYVLMAEGIIFYR